MKQIAILCISFALCLNACKNEAASSIQKPAATNVPEVDNSQVQLPAASEAFIINLYEKVDHIDYMFRNTNFSISQDEKEATQAMISTLSPAPARVVNSACKSPIRITYLALGEIIAESEMYMTENCQYVEYWIDGKKTFHNNYSQEGYNFLSNIMNSAQNVSGQ